MRKILEGSHAVAEAVRMCAPGVVSAYPITPQTHIVERLADFKANGQADYEYVLGESEFAAASIVEGAVAAGVRSYSATSSQGLLLMAEVLFNIAGMRLPLVLSVANRAISAPINIWNDQQDAVTVRDSGWIMLYAEDNQEAIDMHIQAFKISERVKLPVMVNMDGYVLTHTYEPLDMPSQADVKKYLPAYKPKANEFLNIKNPRTFGAFATPETYMELRQELYEIVESSRKVINQENRIYKDQFGRGSGDGFTEGYKLNDAETVLVSFGSVLGTMKDVVDELREKGEKVGILKVRCLRPFPGEEIKKALEKAKNIAVVEKCLSLGNEGILGGEVKQHIDKPVKNFVVGLGGKDATKGVIKEIVKKAKGTDKKLEFIYPE
ncbi:pyruvate ferredoxin oxidoreductase [Patescibacteria group bacterium]|nr:pyruvate ferredoxin oxidoreductase [Patescibacteria group bacterium]MBU1673083.1 pyruvate ferredoxin oxidoreductase [Patescibacteria group bacterium]MBU1963689.1 pyruvate ferredoxin oxidoreductase [Patescibacteria group bacterium]